MAALVLVGTRKLAFEPLAQRRLLPDEVRLRTLFSGISAGTELSQYRGTSPFMNRQWDDRHRMFRDGPPSWPFPVRNLGYEEVGEIVEVGSDVSDLKIGDRVFGTWGHRTEHVWSAADAAARRMPEGADPRIGIFSHIGAVALNGVHDARIRMGDLVVVFGLGVPGQIVLQAARASGATVVGVDPVASRRDMAERLGCDRTLDPAAGSVADIIKPETDGRGADICIEVSGVPAALAEAMRTVAYASRVVAMGFFQGEARGLSSWRRIPPQPHRADLEPDFGRRARGQSSLEQAAALADGCAAAARGSAQPHPADHRHGAVRRGAGAVRAAGPGRLRHPPIGAQL